MRGSENQRSVEGRQQNLADGLSRRLKEGEQNIASISDMIRNDDPKEITPTKRFLRALTDEVMVAYNKRLDSALRTSKGRHSKVTDEELIAAYNEGGTLTEIGKRLPNPLSISYVSVRLKKLGMKPHNQNPNTSGTFCKATDKELMASYNEGGSLEEIGKRLSNPITKQAVSVRVKKLGLKSPRKLKEEELIAAYNKGGTLAEIGERLHDHISVPCVSRRLKKLGMKPHSHQDH
jgi:hypothetical protein